MRSCHLWQPLSCMTATMTTLIRIHLFSEQCNKRTEKHRQSVCCHNDKHSERNGWLQYDPTYQSDYSDTCFVSSLIAWDLHVSTKNTAVRASSSHPPFVVVTVLAESDGFVSSPHLSTLRIKIELWMSHVISKRARSSSMIYLTMLYINSDQYCVFVASVLCI